MVHGSRDLRIMVFDAASHVSSTLERTDFGRAHASMRLRAARPMATSICCAPNDRALSRLPIYDGLASADGSFDQRSLAVTGDGLSFRPAVRVDRRDMTISLTGGIGVRPFHGGGARRNDNHSIGAVLDDGVVGRFAVIGAVGGELADCDLDLVEQWIHLRGVAGVLVSHRVSDDLATVGVKRQLRRDRAPCCSSSHWPAPWTSSPVLSMTS